MNNQRNTLDYIKRKAKNLKKELGITHTQALELIAKKYGYDNWTHCHRSLSDEPVRKVELPEKVLQLNFTAWLKKYRNRNSPLGDLATDALRDTEWPLHDNLNDYKSYLRFKHAAREAIRALEGAWKSYRAYLQRKKHPQSRRQTAKKSIVKKQDTRKITYISNVSTLPYNKRSVERFSLGDLAWISWDGRKAIPVTIIEVDDRHYTFRIERSLNKAGNQHYLFLDEVRSTPELACINYVTL